MGAIEVARNENALVGRQVSINGLARLLELGFGCVNLAADILARGFSFAELGNPCLKVRDRFFKLKHRHGHE
jgi:hypothetical protein